MPDWYYIGPDKTGFDCDNCCAGFATIGSSCLPYPCSVPYRPYVCPPPFNPTPHHIYSWDGVSASIVVNSLLCSGSSTQCYSYSYSGSLNEAGRIGSGCLQSYVQSIDLCENEYGPTPICGPCICGGTPVATPSVTYYSCQSCSCVSTGSSASECGCIGGNFICCLYDPDPTNECCVTSLVSCLPCPDGTYRCCDACSGACSPEFCPSCEGECEEPCPPCTVCRCPPGGGSYSCMNICSSSCSSGYTCCSGQCVCNTSSTCCVGYSAGWSYNSSTRECMPCYKTSEGGSFSKSDCCDETWKRKACESGSVCCQDGRCYSSESILCSYPN